MQKAVVKRAQGWENLREQAQGVWMCCSPANLSHSISLCCSWGRPSLCLGVCLRFQRYLRRTKRLKGDESLLALAQTISWGEAELNTRKEGSLGGLDRTAEVHIALIALPCLCVSGWENKFCLKAVEVGSVWEGDGSEVGLGCMEIKNRL